MISQKMEAALNTQINKEMYSAYFYLAMAADLKEKYLDGFSHFFEVQAREEMGHAMKLYAYINEQGGRVLLEAIEKPQAQYKDVEEIFKLTLEHEKYVTKSIHGLKELAVKENDYATSGMLDWFVKEQVEEESNMDKGLHMVKMANNAPQALMFLDSQFGKRGE
ncbi:MAG TPA: ferritin [bacterium]|nr:ferritin [bacterium]HPR89532.1 ferritin [bacterium]